MPKQQLEDLTQRQIIVWFVVPLLLAACALRWAFVMKEAELIQCKSSAPRIAVTVVGGAIGFLSTMMLVFTYLAKGLIKLGFNPNAKGSVGANLFAVLALIGPVVPAFAGIELLDKQNEQMEFDALKDAGVPGRFCITAEERRQGRHDVYYQYTLFVRDNTGNRHKLSVTRSEHGWLQVGDSVSIMYLPQNPTVFREADIPGDE